MVVSVILRDASDQFSPNIKICLALISYCYVWLQGIVEDFFTIFLCMMMYEYTHTEPSSYIRHFAKPNDAKWHGLLLCLTAEFHVCVCSILEIISGQLTTIDKNNEQSL